MIPPDDKTALRRRHIEYRLAIAAANYNEWSQACCLRLYDFMEALPVSRGIAGYMPIRGEMDIIPALLRLHQKQYRLAMPVTDSGSLLFRPWQPGDAMEQGHYGIPHPRHPANPVIPDIVIVPLVGFDRKGHRLGYGKGYYDRALEALRAGNAQLLAIGAAFSLQEVPALSAEAHDQKLDMVVTEKEIIRP